MSAKYLLPCSCGLEVAIEPAQAGQKVQCACGRQLDVPTMREIVQLERFEAEDAPSSSASAWGLRHALLVIGVLLVALSVAAAAYVWTKRPQPANLDNLSVLEVWPIWEELRQGVDRPPMPDQLLYADRLNSFHVQMWGTALLGALGIVCLVVTIALRRKPQSLRSTNMTSSDSPTMDAGSSGR